MSGMAERQNGSTENPERPAVEPAPVLSDIRSGAHEQIERATNADILEHVMRELGVDPNAIPSKNEFTSETWTKLRKPGDIMALKNALQAGVPPEEAKRFLAAHIAPFITGKRLSVAARALVNTGIASSELCTYMANIVIDSLLFQHGHKLTEGLIREELNGFPPDILNDAIDWMNRSSFEAPEEPVIDFSEEDDDDDIEMPAPISFSPDRSMRDLWNEIDDVLSEKQRDYLDAELCHQHRSISTLLIVDAPDMEMSVREFCSMEHVLSDGTFVISLEELEEALPVRFVH